MALETFRIISRIAPLCLQNLAKVKDNRYNFRYKNILQVPSSSTCIRTSQYGKKSHRYSAAVLLDSFP
jgi:hypothetical protein